MQNEEHNPQKENSGREEYEKQLREEKIRLIRQKQGLEESPEIVPEEKIPLTKKEKVKNFWDYHKWKVIWGTVGLIAVLGIVISILTKVEPDYSVMILTLDHEGIGRKTDEFSQWMEQYGEDVNGDGKVIVQTVYAPIGNLEQHPEGVQGFLADQTMLMAEFQLCKTVFFVVDAPAEEQVTIEEFLKDYREEYPESPAVVRGGLLLSATDLKEALGLSALPEGAYLGIREYTEDSYEPETLKQSCEAGEPLMERLLQKFGES